MILQSTRFGEIEIDQEKIIDFPDTLPGLPNSVRYVILDIDEKSPFKWLQSCDQPEIAMIITDPLVFFPKYQVKISKEELGILDLEDGNELEVAVILVIPANPRMITANLMAPLVINATKKKAGQIVLADSIYSTRHMIFPSAQEAV